MRTNISKANINQEVKKSLKRPHLVYMLLITTAVIIIYTILIRPHLVNDMTTVTVELIITSILILVVITTLATLLFTLLITLIVAINKRSIYQLEPWIVKLRDRFIFTVVFSFILLIFALITQKVAYTPPILGQDGKQVQGSIASLEKINLGDSQQWITIRGNDRNKPVLLFLAGGPGGSQLAATRAHLRDLEEHYVVVNWDQPGSGKSYNSVPLKELTPERYISDAHQLTMYLCQRFNKEKIFVVGESWGSALGIWLVQQYPELFHAFIGTGQMVSFMDTETMCYEQALKIAKKHGDLKKIEELKLQGAPPYFGKDVVWKESAYLMYLSNYMGNNPNIKGPGYNTLGDMAGPEYGLFDKVNYFRGIVKTFNHVYQQLYDFDLRKQATKLDVPVVFMIGRHDLNAPPILVEEYFNLLDAPIKKIIWFENSGHSPWINEQNKFVDKVVNLPKRVQR